MPPVAKTFAPRVLAWSRRRGRTDLPWQTDKTPYRVWVSEVMLQQTQVQSVIPYFLRFMERCPEVGELAVAPPETVAELWSGLGYYARAQNLHKAAKIIVAEHAGRLPDTLDGLMSLPGVGRSTAGAILALCHRRRLAILDGNVKRLLARHRLVAGYPGRAAVARRLWRHAENLLPESAADMPAYTQALMDLGATVCTRAHARCADCPVSEDCLARARRRVGALPEPRPRKTLSARRTYMLLATCEDRVLLARRATSGLWAGLLCPPEVDSERAAAAWARRALGLRRGAFPAWPEVRHAFSHFRLDITPLVIRLRKRPRVVREAESFAWCKIDDGIRQAPAPVKKLLSRLRDENHGKNGALR